MIAGAGHVLIVGGTNDGGFTVFSSAELYRPLSD
jgi:hypothetical protein